MPNPTIISCALHDHIEISCLYGYQLKLILKNRQTIEGKAIDVLTGSDKKEYLLLESGQQIKIELTEIKELQVLTPQAKFHTVSFNLEKSVEREFIAQDIGFTVFSKNLSFTHRLSGHFLEVRWNQELVLETVSN